MTPEQRAVIEAIQDELFCDDIAAPPDDVTAGWSEEDIRTYFLSGGQTFPPTRNPSQKTEDGLETLAALLRSIGLQQYVPLFEEEEITDVSMLQSMPPTQLVKEMRELGLEEGHIQSILAAITPGRVCITATPSPPVLRPPTSFVTSFVTDTPTHAVEAAPPQYAAPDMAAFQRQLETATERPQLPRRCPEIPTAELPPLASSTVLPGCGNSKLGFWRGMWRGRQVALLEMEDCALSRDETELHYGLQDCPGVARVLGCCHCPQKGALMLVMEYAERGDLLQVLEAGGLNQCSLAVKLAMAVQLATALAAITSRGVIHGDVKLENILVHSLHPHDPEQVELWLTDFGTAILELHPSALAQLPPAQKAYMFQGDVSSLATIIWHLFRGPHDQLAFKHSTFQACGIEIEDFGTIPAQPAACPTIVYVILCACWAPYSRRPTMAEALDCLRCVQALLRLEGVDQETALAMLLGTTSKAPHFSVSIPHLLQVWARRWHAHTCCPRDLTSEELSTLGTHGIKIPTEALEQYWTMEEVVLYHQSGGFIKPKMTKSKRRPC